MSDLTGQTIVNYQVTTVFAEDRLGVLYEATDIRNQTAILLRVVHPELAQASFQSYFLKQAARLKALTHPGIVPILDADYRDSHLYLAMKWVSELTLEGYLKRELSSARGLDHKVAIHIARQLAEALHYASQQSVEHYGLCPRNILITQANLNTPSASIFEFGFSPLIDQYGSTVPDPIALRYLAPEQCVGEKPDARTDIYALGCIMYELFTGRPPFSPQNVKEATRMHKEQVPSRPSNQLPNLPPELETELDKIIMRCLDKDRLRRYQNAGELARALSDFENIRPPVVAPPPPPVPTIDHLIITTNGKAVKTLEIKQNSLILGRKLDGQSLADVPLDGAKISRKHARIDRLKNGDYEITDLGADNGTWINNIRLEPNKPQPLALDTKVKINIYEIAIHRGVLDTKPSARQGLPGGETRLENVPDPVAPVVLPPTKPVTPSQPTVQPTPTVAIPVEPDQSTGDGYVDISNQIKVVVNPSLLEIAVATPATLSITVTNNRNIVDHFPLEIVGLPPEWVVQLPDKIELYPNESDRREIKLLVPALAISTAGVHPFQVRTKGEQHINEYKEYAVAKGEIKIKPFYPYDAELHPAFLRVTSRTRLEITNRGNEANIFHLSGEDREDILRFDFGSESDVKATAGENVTRVVRVVPKNRPIIGMGRNVSFTIRTSSPNVNEPKKISGDIIIWPFIPLPLLMLLAVLLGLLAFTDIDHDGLQNYQEIISVSCRTDPLKPNTYGAVSNDGTEASSGIVGAACTPAPPTLRPTFTAYPTSSIQSGTLDCTDAPPESPLVGFKTGRVLGEKGTDSNRVRTDPAPNSDNILVIGEQIQQNGTGFSVPPQGSFTINNTTPICALTEDGKLLRWWDITYDGVRGWMADGKAKDDPIVEGVDLIATPNPP